MIRIILPIIFLSLNVLAKDLEPISSEQRFDPIAPTKQEYKLQSKILDQAENTQYYLEYLNDSEMLKDLSLRMALNLAPFTKETSREIDTYNYRKRSEIDFPLMNDSISPPEALDYTNSWREAIFNYLPDEDGNVGWGLYSAATPSASRTYGGGKDELALFQLTIPKNTRILDLRVAHKGFPRKGIRNKNGIPIKRELYDELKKICPKIKYKASKNDLFPEQVPDLDYVFVRKAHLTKDKECHEIFVSALKKLNIGLLQYDWHGSELPENKVICDSKAKRNLSSAFVHVNSPLEEKHVSALTNKADLSSHTPKGLNRLKYMAYAMNQMHFYRFHILGGIIPYIDMSGRGLPRWMKDLPEYQKNKDKDDDEVYTFENFNLEKFRHYIRNGKNRKVTPELYFTEDELSEFNSRFKNRILGCSEEFTQEDSPVFDLNRAHAFLLEEVQKQFKDIDLNDLNTLLTDCYKDKKKKVLGVQADSGINDVLKVVGGLLE